MHGIVSLLDEDHYEMVEDIWAGLASSLGVRGIYTTPFPHFSYHVAEHYDLAAMETVLHDFAARTAPFDILTTGLGIFTEGLNPVIYVNVARSPTLSRLNAELWPLLTEASTGIAEYYHPHQWVPHITLAQGDVSRENLGDAIRILSTWDFTWQIHIDNIAVLFNAADARQDVLQFRLPLTGS